MFALLQPESVGWIVAPTYDLAEKLFRVVYWVLKKKAPWMISKVSYSSGSMEIKTILGSTLKAKSAENPDSLVGEGLNWLIIDEAARVKNTLWDGALRPCLADKRGWMIAISTPRGKNWFQELFTRGQDSQFPDYKSFSFCSGSNPFLDAQEIESARLTTPDRLFRQEWLAEFIDDVGGVFKGVKECVGGVLLEKSDRECVTGIDIGKYEDFTVIVVVDKETRKVVYFERFNQLDWEFQVKRIKCVVQNFWKNTLIIDSTGVGDGVFDMIQDAVKDDRRVRVFPFLIKSNSVKKGLIDDLAIAIESKDVGFPDVPELVNEMLIFAYEITAQRNIRYGAPSGYHDDAVLALALAWAGVKRGMGNSLVSFHIA